MLNIDERQGNRHKNKVNMPKYRRINSQADATIEIKLIKKNKLINQQFFKCLLERRIMLSVWPLMSDERKYEAWQRLNWGLRP